jgi:hypothetical protein
MNYILSEIHVDTTKDIYQIQDYCLWEPLSILIKYNTIVTPKTVNILKSVYWTLRPDFSHYQILHQQCWTRSNRSRKKTTIVLHFSHYHDD